MTDKQTQAQADHSNMEKDPNDWVTGEEPMTGAQKSYLKTLSEEAKVDFDETLNKAEASMRIDELQHATGRGAAAPKHHEADAPAHGGAASGGTGGLSEDDAEARGGPAASESPDDTSSSDVEVLAHGAVASGGSGN